MGTSPYLALILCHSLKFATVPLIVVYTLLDLAVDECTMELATARCDLDDESIIKLASSEVESDVQRHHEQIKQLAREPLPYTAVSSQFVKI